MLAHHFCGAGCSCSRGCPRGNIIWRTGEDWEDWEKCKRSAGTNAFVRVFRQQEPVKTDVCSVSDTGCQVQAPTGHGGRMRKAEHLSKNWIWSLLSTLPPPGSKKWSAVVFTSFHWVQRRAWGLGEGGVSWGTAYPLPCICGILRTQLEHSGGTFKAGNESTGRYIKIWPFAEFFCMPWDSVGFRVELKVFNTYPLLSVWSKKFVHTESRSWLV